MNNSPYIDETLLQFLDQNEIKIYPNPASTQLNLEYTLSNNDKAQFYIFDILGREQYKLDLNTEVHKVSFDISRQKSGVYIGKYVVNGVVINTQKIIIE